MNNQGTDRGVKRRRSPSPPPTTDASENLFHLHVTSRLKIQEGSALSTGRALLLWRLHNRVIEAIEGAGVLGMVRAEFGEDGVWLACDDDEDDDDVADESEWLELLGDRRVGGGPFPPPCTPLLHS